MNFLLKRGNRYYFNRRVPSEFKKLDPREIIRIALKTDSRKEAIRFAGVQNDHLEVYWRSLILNGTQYQSGDYESVVEKARLMGFTYLPSQQVAELSLHDLFKRLTLAGKPEANEQSVSTLLGGAVPPKIRLEDAFEKYMVFTKGKTLNKSDNQVRKWLNPRKRTMKTFIECVGDKNKEVRHLTRDDSRKYQSFWIERVNNGTATAGTANKNIIMVKSIIENLNDNLRLGLDTKHLFGKMILNIEDENRRLPFETKYILSTLLNAHNLKGLNEQARWILHAVAETGAGLSEQVGLMPEDIVLDHDIPHIIIQPRSKKALKTKYRKRIIPLVGFALDAFKACPNGFTDYHDKPDSLSGTLSKYLKENKLLPSKNHTVYSLRHSFQDRLLAVNAPDRVQADLMGHKFNRQAYGNGASLEQKFEWLQKIKLKT